VEQRARRDVGEVGGAEDVVHVHHARRGSKADAKVRCPWPQPWAGCRRMLGGVVARLTVSASSARRDAPDLLA
jgi:hypothetical protein